MGDAKSDITARALELAQEHERLDVHPQLEHGGPDASLVCSRCGVEWPDDRHACDEALRNAAPEVAAVLRELVAELQDARASIDNLKSEILETAEQDHEIGRMCADRGFLLANAPIDGVCRMAERYDELVAEVERMRPVVDAAEKYVDKITTRLAVSFADVVDAVDAYRTGKGTP